jgi:hypothetical protein
LALLGAAASRAVMNGSLKLDNAGDGVVGAIVFQSEVFSRDVDAAMIQMRW